MPRFTGQAAGPLGSAAWVGAPGTTWAEQTADAVGKAMADYEAAKQAPPG